MGLGRALVLFLASPLKGALFTGPLISPGTFSYIWLQLEALVCKRNLLLHIQSSHPPPSEPCKPQSLGHLFRKNFSFLMPHSGLDWSRIPASPTTWEPPGMGHPLLLPPAPAIQGFAWANGPFLQRPIGRDRPGLCVAKKPAGAPAHLLQWVYFNQFQP